MTFFESMAILTRLAFCLAILGATMVTLVVIGWIASRLSKRTVRVLMFSSIEEAGRAAFLDGGELRDSSLVTHLRYVPEINRYFVLVEEVVLEERSTGESFKDPG